MSYRTLPLACLCGELPDRILEVGFTSDRHMVIHYWCAACSRVLFVSKTLAECEQDCPPADDADSRFKQEADDALFLQSIGISMPE